MEVKILDDEIFFLSLRADNPGGKIFVQINESYYFQSIILAYDDYFYPLPHFSEECALGLAHRIHEFLLERVIYTPEVGVRANAGW